MPIKMVYNHLPRLTKEMEYAASNVVRLAALRVEQEAKASMSGPKHGRLYRRGGVVHQASAPGEAPAVDTGKLKSSIHWRMITPLKAHVIAATPYARILEMRRRRKYFKPAVEKISDWFTASMAKALSRVK